MTEREEKLEKAIQRVLSQEIYKTFPSGLDYAENGRYVWPARITLIEKILSEALQQRKV